MDVPVPIGMTYLTPSFSSASCVTFTEFSSLSRICALCLRFVATLNFCPVSTRELFLRSKIGVVRSIRFKVWSKIWSPPTLAPCFCCCLLPGPRSNIILLLSSPISWCCCCWVWMICGCCRFCWMAMLSEVSGWLDEAFALLEFIEDSDGFPATK